MIDKRSFGRLLALPALVALAATLLHFYAYSTAAPVSFDGAMNLNTAASLARGSGYGFFYDTFFPFPAQTDGPFILPAALVISAFGISPLTTQAVNLAYVLLFLVAVLALARRIGAPTWAAIATMLACVSTPGFAEYALNGYGEIPSLTWWLFGILVLGVTVEHPSSLGAPVLAGILLSLAYLTKVVALIVVTPVLGVALFALFRDGRNTRAIAALATGLAAPIILWEAYRLVSLGSLAEFAHWWRLQLGQVLAQSGARGQNGVNLFAKALAHLEILRSITGLGALTLAPLLLSPPALALLVRPSLGQRARFLVDCLLAAGVFYFAWWLLVSPTHMAWARRIINGLVILQMLVAFLAVLAARRMLVNLRTVRVSRSMALSAILSLGGLLAAGMLAMNGQHATRPLRSGDDHTGFYALIDRVRTLPSDATVFGTGWWQAPTVALYSGRPIHNIERWTSERINALQSKYLLFDFYAVGLARAQTEQALALVRGEKIFESSGGVLYRIDEARPYAPIEVSAAEVQRLKPRMDFSEGDYEFKSGFYDIESRRHAWMRPDAEVILSRRAERFLRIVLFAPDRLLGTGSVTVSIRTPGCGERTFPLTRAGEHDLRMSLQCDPSADAVPLAVGIHTDAHMPFVRQIDSDNRMRSLVVRSIALVN